MKGEMEVLALIPARGGSKSIPRKNIHPLAGRPLIAYSIAAGLAAETVTRVIVSTDDDEIAEVAEKFGAEVPFMRPEEFARDDTRDLPVFQHALRWLSEHEGYQPEIVVQLLPTSPFRRVTHVDEAVFSLIAHPDADAVRTVCAPFQNPYKMWTIGADGFMVPLMRVEGMSEPYNMPRQALPDVYWQTGYVYASRADTILEKNSMTGERILPLVISADDWIDIDTPIEWRRAERRLLDGEITLDDLGFQIVEV
jgi:N-acylneuraminate cytidylyltransferase